MLLCDCPGLVFPSVAGSKAQMICDGILPIDQMKEYMEPIRLLCQRLSVRDFQETYVIRLRSQAEREEDPDTPELARELLMAHALARGYMTATKGTPDESRSARIILKDVVNAKLLYAVPPPGTEAPSAAADAEYSSQKKLPAKPSTTRYLEQMKAEYEAQEGSSMRTSSRSNRKDRAQQSVKMAAMQWRPPGVSAVPDRLVASGPRVETHQVDLM
uniref:G domain-containing protein n=1 Tax=Haptolina brevifila TaxID=156173 RepID=A0A7S2DHV6_9EUKA|mmetsp:Transcript_3884/g.8505  ORF Transcript_3884/g.8505 Transcript_3884/m.8505 type:complete len:216 (+) Transcript_3884:366-1013(+)